MGIEFWAGPVERFSDAGGEMILGSPSQGLLCTVATGRASAAMARFFLDHCDAVVTAHGSMEGFHDWGGLVGYESACRKAVTDWSVEHQAAVTKVHVFVTQQLVRMGVSVTTIVVPTLQSHDSRDSLVAAFRRADAKAR